MRFYLIVALLGLSACAVFDRDPRSGYLDAGGIPGETARDLYVQRRAYNEQEAREELGFNGRALTEEQSAMVLNRMRLKRLETSLVSENEKRQYFSVRSALGNDVERIRFLSLSGYESRARYIRGRGLENLADIVAPKYNPLIENNDIALGMSQKAVVESWGDPDAVEVAGNPIYSFERWKYSRFISGSDGYEKELRIVYFEGGRVVGWERPQ